MSRQVIVSESDFHRLCRVARVLKRQTGKMPTFAEVIKHLLDQHAS